MRSVSPRPVIVRMHQSWSITPGMSFSVAQDIDNRIWVIETCPAGTQFWTLSQAAMLTGGEKTGDPLEAAIALGRTIQARLANRPAHRRTLRFGLPIEQKMSKGLSLRGAKTTAGRKGNRDLVGV